MAVLGFLVGLAIGLLLLLWQRERANQKMKKLLRTLEADDVIGTPFSMTSQLSLAIAYQQQIRQRLEQQLETLNHVLDEAPIGFLKVDDENQLLWANPVAQRLLCMNHNRQDEPRLLLEIVRSYELDSLIEQIRTSGEPCQSDWIFYPYNPDPTRLSKQQSCALRGYGFVLPDDHVGIFIEDRQESLTLLQQRDRWTSDVAHELKTPLTSIRLIAETLQTRLDSSLQGWADRLINQTTRLSNLVQDLLDLSHLERDAFDSLNLSEVDLNELLHSAWHTLEPIARKKGLQLNYVGPEQTLTRLDEVRFYRVLINLFDNSIKYSPPWGSIQAQLRVESPPSSASNSSGAIACDVVCLDIIDSGPGFTDEDLPYVFERFYRADSSRARSDLSDPSAPATVAPPPLAPGQAAGPLINLLGRSESLPQSSNSSEPKRGMAASEIKPSSQGSGLGLAIVQQIVEAHGGSVVARNHPETGGAWLQLRLPQMPIAIKSGPRRKI